jgi:hypothetical protein
MNYGGRWVIPPYLRAGLADRSGRHQVDPAGYYLWTNPLFETGAEKYAGSRDPTAMPRWSVCVFHRIGLRA